MSGVLCDRSANKNERKVVEDGWTLWLRDSGAKEKRGGAGDGRWEAFEVLFKHNDDG